MQRRLPSHSNKVGLFAISTTQTQDTPATGGAIQGVPYIEKITFHLLRLEDGSILDEKVLQNDLVNLAYNMGVFLYDDLLAIVSLHYQTIHIFQIRDSGKFFHVRAIGSFCGEDDELFLNSSTQVQFLDRHHLLIIRFGSMDGGLLASRANSHTSFFAVYNMETTEIVSFYQNSAGVLSLLFEKFCNHFYATSKNSLYMNFISSHSNNIHALETLRSIKNKAGSFSQFAKKMVSYLPFSCQVLSPSPYFDQSLFQYDEQLISAIERHRPSTEPPHRVHL